MDETAVRGPVPVFIVNLARSPDRRAHMLGQLSSIGLPAELVQGVDGRHLDLASGQVAPELIARKSFRPGAAGCALSHLSVYRSVLDKSLPWALVLEDDVVLPADLALLAKAVADELQGAEVALMNFHAPRPTLFVRTGRAALPGERWLAHPKDTRAMTSAGAYVITAKACARLCEANRQVRLYADEWHAFQALGALSAVRCVTPMPVHNSASFRTTIDYYRPGSLQEALYRRVASAPSDVFQRALAFRRQRQLLRRGWAGAEVFVPEEPSERAQSGRRR